MKHLLIITLPGSEPQQFELKGKRIGLGREVDNDICLDVEAVSSSHLEFRKEGDGFLMEDLNSTNGTRVNGKMTQVTKLADGDRLLIAETVPAHFLVLAENETWEAATAEGSEADQKVAAEYASMSDRLEKLEANIEAKEEETALLEARLAKLHENHQKQLAEYGEAQLALEKLQSEIAAKKQQGGAVDGEIEKLEKDLLERTQRVKVMSSDLAAQKQEISQLEQAAPVPARAPALTPAPQAKKTVPLTRAGQPMVARPPARSGAKTIPLTRLPQRPVAPASRMVPKKKPKPKP